VSSAVSGPDVEQSGHRVQATFGCAEREAAVREHAECLVAAGATLVGERNDTISWWIVLTDPEGNEFCLQ
jgi:predicted enzyme related to lactoylglutathione lyase